MLAEHLTGQSVAKVAAQPLLVGVVAIAAVEVERNPADAALREGELQIGVAALLNVDDGARYESRTLIA